MAASIRRIYLTDDDKDDQELFQDAFGASGESSELLIFDSCSDLLRNLRDPSVPLPDLLYLDLNMPMMNGKECLKELREEKKFAKIRVIIYSTSFELLRIEQLFELGADRYLQKPSSFHALVAAIKRSIDSFRDKKSDERHIWPGTGRS